MVIRFLLIQNIYFVRHGEETVMIIRSKGTILDEQFKPDISEYTHRKQQVVLDVYVSRSMVAEVKVVGFLAISIWRTLPKIFLVENKAVPKKCLLPNFGEHLSKPWCCF